MTKNILKIPPEILDKEREALFKKLLPYTTGFVLGGGTALALQIAHRKSFDFDFFSSERIKKNLAEKLSQNGLINTVSVDTADELTFFTSKDIKVTFLYYPFRHAFPLETLENGLKIFSVKDIAVKKAYTIGRRGEYRDYFDLYTVLKNGYIGLTEVIAETKKIYGPVFDEKIFLQQLVYFEDLLDFGIIPAEKPVPETHIVKQFFSNLVKDYM